MEKISFKKNSLFILFLLVMSILTFGLGMTYGTKYLPNILIFVGSFVAAYLIFDKWFYVKRVFVEKSIFTDKTLGYVLNALIVFVLVFQIIHYLSLGSVPVIKAALSNDYYEIAHIRQDIKMVDSWMIRYTASFVLKAVIPVLIVLLYFRNKKQFWLFAIIAIFYALALMQKAYIATIFIPLILKLIMLRKWIGVVLMSSIVGGGIIFLMYVANPENRPKFEDGNKEVTELEMGELDGLDKKAPGGIATALYQRIFITTGEMVGNWFHFVPDSLVFLNGQGYRLAAPMVGGTYHDYSREIYDKIYLKEAALGLTGTATTAYFMYDYANFGNVGLLIAAIYLAFFLILIKRLFKDDYLHLFALNGLFVLWLSSAAFTTTFFSGGWILVLFLYFIFQPFFKDLTTTKDARENSK